MQGLHSLATLLPLFDGGWRSFYDLRHLTLADTQPNVARWDYHTLHVFQLYWLAQLVDKSHAQYSRLFMARADFWSAYAQGTFAKHN